MAPVNKTVPLPAFKVRAGFVTTPSPLSVLLKVILRLPFVVSMVMLDAVLLRCTATPKDRF